MSALVDGVPSLKHMIQETLWTIAHGRQEAIDLIRYTYDVPIRSRHREKLPIFTELSMTNIQHRLLSSLSE